MLVEIVKRILFINNFLLKLLLIILVFINFVIVSIKGRFKLIISDLILFMINVLLKFIHCLSLFKIGEAAMMPHHD